MWTRPEFDAQTGKTAVVTGANSGIGYWTAHHLARGGAKVVLACRNPTKADEALQRIRADLPEADVRFEQLDLADLDSVARFVEALDLDRIDLLINNAGVMALPYRKTAQGFEMQFGTNHLGHFALTGQLFPRIAEHGRVVTVTSHTHRVGTIDFDDLQHERRYQRWLAYGQSKLANLLFTYGLGRRCDERGLSVLSLAAHPGYSDTHLHIAGAEMERSFFKKYVMTLGSVTVAQSSDAGSWPTVMAATDPEAEQGAYYGPKGLFELGGPPGRVSSTRHSHDEALQDRLWQVSEELVGPFRWE